MKNVKSILLQRGVAVLIATLFGIAPLSAASAQERAPQPLSLQGAVERAMKNDPELLTARLEVDRADSRVMEAWGSALPSIDLSATYTRTLKTPIFFAVFNGVEMGIEMGLPHSFSAVMTGKQLLFNGAVIVGVGAAHYYSDLARDLYAAKQLETVTRVRKAYYGALVAQEVVAMMHGSLHNAEDNLRNVLVMRRQGIVSEYDELRATVQVENLRPSVMQSENNFQLALDAVRNLIGSTDGESLQLTDSLKFVAIDDSVIAGAEMLVRQSNPGLRAVNHQIDLHEAAVWAERSGYLPTIALFGQYQYQAAKDRFRFSTNDLISSSQVGISVSLNIFQGGQTFSRVEQAQLERRKAEQQKIGVERSLQTGVHSVTGNLRQARKRVEAQQKTVETAERGYSIVSARYRVNAATQLEVNDAQVALDQARVNRIQAIYDYFVASAELDQLIGRLPEYARDLNE